MAHQITSTCISKLTKYVYNAELKVRVVSLWIRFNQKNKEEIYAIEMILVDEQGHLIQATINNALMYKFSDIMKEGCTYKLGRFIVSDNNGHMTATKNLWRIRFQCTTYAIEIIDLKIPKFGFCFTSFGDIIDDHVLPNTYIDVIGVLEMLHPIAVSEQGNEWTHIDITDKDKNILSFYVFGDYVNQVVKINNEYADANERPILALQSVIRSEWKGEVRIRSHFQATRIHVNPDVPEIKDFKERGAAMGSNSKSSIIAQTKKHESSLRHRLIFITVTELNSIEEAGVYSTLATITKLDEKFKWFYYSCMFCHGEATLSNEKLWRCNRRTCRGNHDSMTYAIPRFQVMCDIIDGEYTSNEETNAKLLLFETQLEAYVDKTAAECLFQMKEAGNREGMPKELKVLIGKQWVCKIEVSRRYKNDKKSDYFTATAISDDEDIIDWWKAKYHATKINQLEMNEYYGSGISEVRTPPKRKILEIAECDEFGSSGKSCISQDQSSSKITATIKKEN